MRSCTEHAGSSAKARWKCAHPCVCSTPFGLPVVPLVNIINAPDESTVLLLLLLSIPLLLLQACWNSAGSTTCRPAPAACATSLSGSWPPGLVSTCAPAAAVQGSHQHPHHHQQQWRHACAWRCCDTRQQAARLRSPCVQTTSAASMLHAPPRRRRLRARTTAAPAGTTSPAALRSRRPARRPRWRRHTLALAPPRCPRAGRAACCCCVGAAAAGPAGPAAPHWPPAAGRSCCGARERRRQQRAAPAVMAWRSWRCCRALGVLRTAPVAGWAAAERHGARMAGCCSQNVHPSWLCGHWTRQSGQI